MGGRTSVVVAVVGVITPACTSFFFFEWIFLGIFSRVMITFSSTRTMCQLHIKIWPVNMVIMMMLLGRSL